MRTTDQEISEQEHLLSQHGALVKKYFKSPLEDRSKIFVDLSIAWRKLKNLKATGEAHVFAVNEAVRVGKLRPSWRIVR